MSDFTLTLRANKHYRLRDGSTVLVQGSRDALMLNGRDREPIWYGKFTNGGLCAWNLNGTYRASNKRHTHPLDICEEVD